jgi:hypothetical protein
VQIGASVRAIERNAERQEASIGVITRPEQVWTNLGYSPVVDLGGGPRTRVERSAEAASWELRTIATVEGW